MNQLLKEALLREHARDKKLTFIAYSLIAVIVLVVLFFFGRIILNSVLGSDVPPYVRYVLAIALLFYIGYAVAQILKLNKRTQEIEELFAKLESGSKATDVHAVKEYRFMIPLGKVTFQLFPVEFQVFALDCNMMKSYKLPVHPIDTAEFLKLLSGVNTSALNEQLSELYAETPLANSGSSSESFEQMQETEAYDDTPMKSTGEYKEFLKTELGDTVAEIESDRKKSRKMTILFGVAAVAVVLCFMGYIFFNMFTGGSGFSVTNVFILMGVLFAGYYAFYFLHLKPKMKKEYGEVPADKAFKTPQYKFKTEILPRIIDYINPGAHYLMHGRIDYYELMANGLFREDTNYEISGNDMIVGRYRGVPYQFCDLTVEVKRRITREDDDPEYAFYGQYFTARFNKSFSNPVYIIPRTGIKGFFMDNSASVYLSGKGDKVQLEDPEFMKMFNVYSDDQIEARYIMTPAMMERIKQLALRTKGQYYISFYENRITVANNSGKNTLEMKSNKSLEANDYQELVGFYEELRDEFSIIDDLKLNIKIWR